MQTKTVPPHPQKSASEKSLLERAVDSRAGTIEYTPTPKDPSKDTIKDPSKDSINLGVFGFRNPDDLKKFLLTPAGETVKTEISTQIAQNEAIQEREKAAQLEQLAMDHRLKAALFLWLLEKESHAKGLLHELIEEQNDRVLGRGLHAKEPALLQAKTNEDLKQSASHYDQVLSAYQGDLTELSAKEKALDNEYSRIVEQKTMLQTKHKVYTDSMKDFEKSSDKYEEMDKQQLEKEIKSLEQSIELQSDEISKILANKEIPDEEKEATVRSLLHKQNATNLQLASLYDLRDIQDKKKFFLNAEGMPTNTDGTAVKAKDAAFIVGDQNDRIVEKNGKHYLLKAGEDLDSMPPQDLEKAQFKAEEARSVKKTMEVSLQRESEFHDKRLGEVDDKKAVNKQQQLELENQIKQVQASKAKAQQGLSQSNQMQVSPTPSNTSVLPAGASSNASAVETFFKENKNQLTSRPQITPKEIYKLVDNLKNSRAKQEVINFLNKTFNLNKLTATAPLPETTMNLLLSTVERFGGVDAYKLTAQQQRPEPKLDSPQHTQKHHEENEDPDNTHKVPYSG